VASTTLVDKLQLKIKPHPQTYSIQRLNQGKGLKVSAQCLICLSIIKKYFDELWCDIIQRDAFHVLLRRPWLYDRKVTYDGFLNTYTLHKNSRKTTLIPLPPHQITKSKSIEPLKDGGVLLSFLEPTLKVEQSEFNTFKEIILHTPTLGPQTETPLHPLTKQLL